MNLFVKDNGKKELCLFFCGWGTDEKLYLHLLNDFDYILFYDYSDINTDFDFDFSKYENIYLIGYSAGVSIPALLKDKLPETTLNIAVNGSLKLLGGEAVSQNAVKACETVDLSNYIDFRRNYLISSPKELELFNENAPLRTFESCYAELAALKKLSEDYKDLKYNYDILFTSEDDKFFNSEILKKEFKNSIGIKGGHFPFFRYKSFKYFVDESKKYLVF